MKKLVALFLAAALTLSLVACGGGGSSSAAPAGSGSTAGSSAAASTPKEPLNVALLYGGTLGAQAFIDVVDKGFKQAAADFGINYSVLENVELSAAADTFRTVIANGADVLVVADVKWNEALAEVADENPDFPFVHLDADGTGGLSSAHPNIYEVSYKEHESAFLNGVFCALMSKTGKVAQIQGSDSGTMIRFNSCLLYTSPKHPRLGPRWPRSLTTCPPTCSAPICARCGTATISGTGPAALSPPGRSPRSGASRG